MPFYFEDQVLEPARRELTRGGETVMVEPKVFDLLVYLIENRDRLVSKDDLIVHVWHGRIVSDSALTSAINAARMAVADSGREQRLIRTSARKGFRFVGSVVSDPGLAANTIAEAEPAPTMLNLPSIAVLPFENLSSDPDRDYFADGVVEDIITALSRFKSLFVIARNSSFTYKGRAVDIKQVGQELGVRYVLEGSVRRASNRTRITGQLIQADTRAHIWADRYDGDLADIFELQEEVASAVAGAIAPKLERAEIQRVARKPTKSTDAYDIYLRGMSKFYQWTMEGANEASRLFRQAIELDSGFAAAHAMAAHVFCHRKALGLTLTSGEVAETADLARRAVELGDDDSLVLSLAGWALAYVVHDLPAGSGLVDRAILLNPNLAVAQFASGWLNVWLGKPDVAIEHLAHAMRLSPIDPAAAPSMVATAHAHFMAQRYDEALSWADKATQAQRTVAATRIAAASAAAAGRLGEARRFIEQMRQIDPTRRLSNVVDTLGPYRRLEDLERYKDALRVAGLPE